MKVKNISNKVKHFKINGEWQSVNPGKCFEAPMDVISNEPGLELCGKKKAEKVLKDMGMVKTGPDTFEPKEQVNPLDLDGDGDVDKDDGSLAGKVMAKLRHGKGKKK